MDLKYDVLFLFNYIKKQLKMSLTATYYQNKVNFTKPTKKFLILKINYRPRQITKQVKKKNNNDYLQTPNC